MWLGYQPQPFVPSSEKSMIYLDSGYRSRTQVYFCRSLWKLWQNNAPRKPCLRHLGMGNSKLVLFFVNLEIMYL